MKHISILVHFEGNRHEQNLIKTCINLLFVGEYRIKEFFAIKYCEMKAFLPENNSHFLCFEIKTNTLRRTLHHICAASQTLHMHGRFSSLSPPHRQYGVRVRLRVRIFRSEHAL